MSLKILQKTSLPSWIESLLQGHRLIGPKVSRGGYRFDEIFTAEEIAWEYTTTILPPKKALFPPCQELLEFDLVRGQIRPILQAQPTILLGVHTCDLHAIQMLDVVLNNGLADQHYMEQRRQTTLVSIECLAPCSEHSFCKDMGTLSTPREFDLHLVDLGDTYAVEIGSPAGEALFAGIDLLEQADDQALRLYNRTQSAKWAQFTYRLKADLTELLSLLTVSRKSTLWQELEERCMGCGSCNIVCPTCYCFDVVDEIDFALNAGKRWREWDSCQLNQFASVAGGHDFRPSRANRQRHRFMRKYNYQSIDSGLVGCVGCGRCAQACLVNITPVEALNQLAIRKMTAPVRK